MNCKMKLYKEEKSVTFYIFINKTNNFNSTAAASSRTVIIFLYKKVTLFIKKYI